MDYSSLFAGPTASPQSLFGNGMGASPLMSLFGGGGNPQQAMQMMQSLFAAGSPSTMPQGAARLAPMAGMPSFAGVGGVSPASAMNSPMAAFHAAAGNPYGAALGRALGPMNNMPVAPFRQMQQL